MFPDIDYRVEREYRTKDGQCLYKFNCLPSPRNPRQLRITYRSVIAVRVTNLDMRVYGLSTAANQQWEILRIRRIPRDSAEELVPLGIDGYIFSRSALLYQRIKYTVVVHRNYNFHMVSLGAFADNAGVNPGSPFSIALLKPSLSPILSKYLTIFGYSSSPYGKNKRPVVNEKTVTQSAAVSSSPAKYLNLPNCFSIASKLTRSRRCITCDTRSSSLPPRSLLYMTDMSAGWKDPFARCSQKT